MAASPPIPRLTHQQGLPDMLPYRINRQLMAPLHETEIALPDDFLARMEQRAAEIQANGPVLPLADRRRGGTMRRAGPDEAAG